MRTVCAFVVTFLLASRVLALDLQVKEVRAASTIVQTTLEVRDVVPERFKKMLDSGNVLHLRLQAELWESRPVWDRLVYPAITRVFRLVRAVSGGEISISDGAGSSTSYAAVPNPLPLQLDLGQRDRISASQKYYVHAVVTLGTIAEREVDAAGDAVFGRESETNGLGSLGRLVFRTVLQVSDYLQSVSAETRGGRTPGADIVRQVSP